MSKPTSFKVANCDLEETRVNPEDSVQQHIFVVRGQRVMLDRDLAQLILASVLNSAVSVKASV